MAELDGCGFPVAACAQLDAAHGELGAARDELAAVQDVVAWVASAADAFRDAAAAQWREATSLADASASAAAGLRQQGVHLATGARCHG
ncbi:hypothetical protein [Microbacterium sp. JZ31]|uniref:hypothetical protein n=1 Tax=Microbacterium sp. JZ31 TaxID=1906274 RepID=UPI0019324CFE|nr:hypothetical protein [Microbacterium sp. JZ31]